MGPDTRGPDPTPPSGNSGAGSATFAQNTAEEVMMRAKELGLLARLQASTSASEGLSLGQLTDDHAAAGAAAGSAEEVETVLNSLVQLKVVDEAEPKVYRLAPRSVNQADNTHLRGGSQAGSSWPPAPAEPLSTADTNHTVAMPPGGGQQLPTAAQAPMYPAMYPGYPPRGPQNQYYTAVHQHLAGIAQAPVANQNIQIPGSEAQQHAAHHSGPFHPPAVLPTAYTYPTNPPPVQSEQAASAAGASWPAGGSMGSFSSPPPPPPPPRSAASSAPTSPPFSASPVDRQANEPQPSSSGKAPCAFFLKTGTCAYGDKCKFDHPAGRQPPRLNSMGYPLRPNEADCGYFLKRGVCGFGITCKFNHPELHTMGWPPHGSPPVPNLMPNGHMLPFSGMMPASMMPMHGYSPRGPAVIPQTTAAIQAGVSPPGGAAPMHGWAGMPPPTMMGYGLVAPIPGVQVPPVPVNTAMPRNKMPSRSNHKSPTAHIHEMLRISPSKTGMSPGSSRNGNPSSPEQNRTETYGGSSGGTQSSTEAETPKEGSSREEASHPEHQTEQPDQAEPSQQHPQPNSSDALPGDPGQQVSATDNMQHFSGSMEPAAGSHYCPAVTAP